jgi:hypothetical protein
LLTVTLIGNVALPPPPQEASVAVIARARAGRARENYM